MADVKWGRQDGEIEDGEDGEAGRVFVWALKWGTGRLKVGAPQISLAAISAGRALRSELTRISANLQTSVKRPPTKTIEKTSLYHSSIVFYDCY